MRTTTLAAVSLTLIATLLIFLAARASYDRNEERLTILQTRLSGLLVKTAPVQIESQLYRVVGLSAESADPTATFRAAMAPLLKPRGPYSSAVLVRTAPGPDVLVHLGTAPIKNPEGSNAIRLYGQAVRSTDLVTTRAVAGRIQKFGFLVSAHGSSGTYVVGAGQQLPSSRHVTLPASSPDAGLNFALYYGTKPSSASLIETNTSTLPIGGTVSSVVIPFGTVRLTLVAAPRSSLAGAWSEDFPWAILALGVLLSAAVGLLTEWLGRRRRDAESVAHTAQDLYDEQREVSRAMQMALLPKELPTVGGVEFAASYLPATKGAEVGGDWYSVIEIDEDRFAFVVGDVSGHGISAVSLMAPLRFSIRTLALIGMSPSEILRRADTEIDVVRDDHFATVLVGVVDTERHSVTLASAGHPLPVLLVDGHCEQLQLSVGSPLGLHETHFPEHVLFLGAEATLIAFTDGLVERRGQAFDIGVGQLKRTISAQPGESAETTLHKAISEVASHDNEDDIALLVIRMLPVLQGRFGAAPEPLGDVATGAATS